MTISAVQVDGKVDDSLLDLVVSRLAFRPELSATKASVKRWNALPGKVGADGHIALLHIERGKRIDFIALFRDPTGRSVRVARAPALKGATAAKWFKRRAGEGQLPRNAPIDLIAEMARTMRQPAGTGPVASLAIKLGPAGKGGAPFSAEEHEQLHALALAAATSCGWQIVDGNAPVALNLRLARSGLDCLVDARRSGEGGTRTIKRIRVTADNGYEDLRRLFLDLAFWKGRIFSWVRVYQHFFSVLGHRRQSAKTAMEEVIIGGHDRKAHYIKSIFAVGSCHAKPLWTAGGKGTAYLRLPGRPGRIVCRSDKGAGLVSVQDGTVAGWIGEEQPEAWQLALAGEGLVVARGTQITLAGKDGTAQWTATSPKLLVSGPAPGREHILACDASGMLRTWTMAEGKAGWTVGLEAPLTGPLNAAGRQVYGMTERHDLVAIDYEAKKVAWTIDAGDVLLAPPRLVAGKLLVVSKTHRILVIDPTSGKAMSSRQWPTWISFVVPARVDGRQVLVCADAGRKLHLLAWPGLETIESLPMPERLTPTTLFVPAFGSRWGGNQGLEEGASLLMVDQLGYIYALAVEGGDE